MPKGKYTVSISFRLNPENEQHYRIIDMLERVDLKVYKSKSQFIINVLDEYSSELKGNGKQAEATETKVFVDDEKYRQEIKDMARDEILHMLGAVAAGRESASGVYRQEMPGAGIFQEEHTEEETEGNLSEDVKNLIGKWSQ